MSAPALDRGAARIAAAAWAFRCTVERDADVRFERLAARMASAGGPPPLIALARRASEDERRHAALCARLAERYGAAIPHPAAADPPEVAPRHLGEREALLYEVVAACCVAETVSVAVLTALLDGATDRPLRAVLRELAGDEVRHARLGWAWLAREAASGETAFLGPLVPAMLAGSAPADLSPSAAPHPGSEDALLVRGVLAPAAHREVFGRTLADVVFPGLEAFGVDASAAREWLAAR